MTNIIDYVAMAVQQKTDCSIKRIISDPESALHVIRYQLPDSNECLLVDVSTGKPRPLVPAVLARTIFDLNHELSHAGVKAMRRLICERFVWSGMSMDIRQWTRTCVACQRAKVTTHVRAPVEQFPLPSSRFDSLHVDLVGPLPPS